MLRFHFPLRLTRQYEKELFFYLQDTDFSVTTSHILVVIPVCKQLCSGTLFVKSRFQGGSQKVICLFYGTEAVALNATQRRSLSHTWQYVVSKVFYITGDNVSFVCNVTEAVPFCELLIHRNVCLSVCVCLLCGGRIKIVKRLLHVVALLMRSATTSRWTAFPTIATVTVKFTWLPRIPTRQSRVK